MSRQLQVASKLEMRAVIRFLGEKINCCEMFRHLYDVYGENATGRQAIANWCDMLHNERTDIDDAQREGRPSTATESEIDASVNECILAKRHITIDEISNKLGISYGSVHKIIADQLQFHKFCARWCLVY
ncbi:uncharacterized protein LOC118182374 [Stegodyphus dumicola]|uniref:uncharacterized protein LOC118182374 n=1 Tax=Stegodyphus dumicola TaxID=202533 RepID=UPI0015A9DE6F|nr:uncharacterized protein LOC118182374 [Stegodyphus dumicola]